MPPLSPPPHAQAALCTSTADRQLSGRVGQSILSTKRLLALVVLSLAEGDARSDNNSGTMFSINSRGRACFYSTAQMQHISMRARTAISGRQTLSTAAASKDDFDAETSPSPSSFYERLNSPRHILAPMVAQSDLPFRLMCEQLYGVDLSYTQMIHAYNFVEANGETFRTNHLDVYPQSTVRDILLGNADRRTLLLTPSQKNALLGLSENEIEQARKRILASIPESTGSEGSSELALEAKPTVVQIAAHDPDVAVEAAMLILERSGSMESIGFGGASPVAAIDLNLGCPQKIARTGRYGSFLHDESPETTYKVLTALREKLPRSVGITAKIRLPPTPQDAAEGKLGNLSRMKAPQTLYERMRCLIDCGVDLITVHGRTRFMNKVAVGAADWDAVRQCVDTARSYSGDDRFPVFANGGIEFYEDVRKCFAETNASGIMSSESLLERPGVFCSEVSKSTTAKHLLERQLGYAEMYLDYATIIPPLPGSLGTRGGSFNVIRSHLFKILHRYLEENPNLRSWLGDQELQTIKEAKNLLADLRSRYSNLDDDQLMLMNSWADGSSWYRRHRRRKPTPKSEQTGPVSMDERKKLAKIRIQKMREERSKRSANVL